MKLPVVSVWQATKTVIIVGPQIKPYKAIEATLNLADASKYATAVLPNAKVHFYTKSLTGTCTHPEAQSFRT